MIDILAANAEKTELRDRPTAESLAAAREAGAFRLAVSGATATEVAGLLTTLGRGCASTAWIAGTCLASKTLATLAYSETVLAELFADPDALFCGSGVPGGTGVRGPDGVRLNGRWPNASGCEDAAWGGFGAIVDGVFSLVQVPMADLTIDRTWQMAGMRGTGSHTVVADDVLVPAERIGTLQLPPSPLTSQLFGLSVLAPVVGATFAGLDVMDAMFASERKPFMTAYTRMGDSPGARHWLAEATTLTERAERTMLAIAAELDTGAELSERDASRLHLTLTEAGRDCRAAMELMLDLHGASGFRTSNPLQRLWRDVAVAGRHPHLNTYLAMEGYGEVLTRNIP